MTADENIVNKVCERLQITQRELAKQIDIPESTIARWKSGDLPRLADLYLNLLLENKNLKDQILKLKSFKTLLDEI